MNGLDLLEALSCIDPQKLAEADQEDDDESVDNNVTEDKKK